MRKNQKKKKIVWQQYIGMAFMMLTGAICGVVMVSYCQRYNCKADDNRKHGNNLM